MLKLLIYGIIYSLLFREIYSVVLYDLYGEKNEYMKKRERAARQADCPQRFKASKIIPAHIEACNCPRSIHQNF